MKARLLILLAVAVGLGVYFVTKPPKITTADAEGTADGDSEAVSYMTADERAVIAITNQSLEQRSLAGDEPNPRPELTDFSVRTEVNTTTGKNELCFYVTEKHGYYVETLRVQFWYTGKDGKLTAENSPLVRYDYINKYIKTNETLKHCIQLVLPEINQAGGAIGTSPNWAARVTFFNRSRTKNPDPLPPL